MASQVLGVLCTWLESGSDMGQHFQMTMYRGSVSYHLEGYVLMLLTCDPQGFLGLDSSRIAQKITIKGA